MIISSEMSPFAENLLIWYKSIKRDLPWRANTNPYNVWISEIILQQTRVAQGMDYYLRFLNAFPTVHDLAAAKEADVLRLWQGLGYYSRARNLLEAARWVVNNNRGQFPSTIVDLRKLKGVGPYTAAAIGSICFDLNVPAVDGNAYRVAARYFGIDFPIDEHGSMAVFSEVLHSAMFGTKPGDFNQAVMELGALICTPLQPNCLVCPLMAGCSAFAEKKTTVLPTKKKKTAVKEIFLNYIFVTCGDKFLMRLRMENGIWKNLWDFPAVESESPIGREKVIEIIKEKLTLDDFIVSGAKDEVTHLLTHRKLRISFIHLSVDSLEIGSDEYARVSFQEAEKLPKPIPIVNFLIRKLGQD
jgi:A/G-specific adenine glycosylase